MNDKGNEAGPARREWRKPKLERVGTIRDIAVRNFPFNQAANGKKS